ncbi:MAG: SEC-C domain-containing protein [Solirubrobacteraceae bacterium]
MSTGLEPHDEVRLARERRDALALEHGELHPETIAAAAALAAQQLAAGESDGGVDLLRGLSERATASLGEESEITGLALAAYAEVLGRAGGPPAEQLGPLTDAIKAFSASVGPSDPRTIDAFARLAHVALDAQAVEVAVTAGMQALGGLTTRGEGDGARAGGVYATLAMAAAARQSPAAMGAAERAHALTAALPAADPARRRARTAWSALGSPRRIAVTGELAVIAFGSPASLVIEYARVANDGAADQHNHGLRAEAARALRAAIASAPFAWRSSAGGFEIVSRSGAGAALRFLATAEGSEDVEVALDAGGLQALRSAVADALGGALAADQPRRNDLCPCGSGSKYKRCCGA